MSSFYRSDLWVKAALGFAIAGAQIWVCTQPTNLTLPPTPLAPIFSDPAGANAVVQPLLTDGEGHADYYAVSGTYCVVVAVAGVIQNVYPDQTVGLSGTGSGTVINVGALTSGSIIVGDGGLNVSAGPVFSGDPTQFLNGAGGFSVPPSGSGTVTSNEGALTTGVLIIGGVGGYDIQNGPAFSGNPLTFLNGLGFFTTPASLTNATQLQGTPVSAATPLTSQILEFNGTSWVPVNQAAGSSHNIVYSTDYIWVLTGTSAQFPALTAGTPALVVLSTVPLGWDGSLRPTIGYWIYINDGANSEAVRITGGTAVAGGTNLNAQFTPYYNHSAGVYTLATATAGIQEAINAAVGISAVQWENGCAKIVIPPQNERTTFPYNIYATITMQAWESELTGYGAQLCGFCRGPVLQVGNLIDSNNSPTNTISGITFSSGLNPATLASDYLGSLITQTACATGVVTITTAAPHNFRVGDSVTIQLTDNNLYWGDVPNILSVPTPSSFTYNNGGTATVAPQTTPGIVALSYFCVLDNGTGTRFVDIKMDNYNSFNGVFDLWDDENCTIDHFNNNGTGLNRNINWTPSFVFSYGNNNYQSAVMAPVLTLTHSGITAQGGNGVTIKDSNGVYISDTIIQATGPWTVSVSNECGNYQGADIQNIYCESASYVNPASPAKSPWPGLGTGGLFCGPSTGVASFSLRGQHGFNGGAPTNGSGGTTFIYYVVVHDVTASTQTPPLVAMYWQQAASGAVTVSWPRVANGTDVITYDVLRQQLPVVYSPYPGGCPGGSVAALGSVVVGQAQQSGFVQTFVDSTASSTTAYASAPWSYMTGTYVGHINFWPYAAMTSNITVNAEHYVPVAGIGMKYNPSVIALNGITSGNDPSPVSVLTSTTGFTFGSTQALLLEDGDDGGGDLPSGTKGRLNFIGTDPSGMDIQGHHFITLVDSNPAKTRAYPCNRPVYDAADTFIGLDNPTTGNHLLSSAKLAFGAPVSISHYINNVGDGTSWLESLTATQKTFAVPVRLNSTLLDGAGSVGTLGQMLLSTGTGVVWGAPALAPLWSSLGNAAADLTLSNGIFNTTFNQNSPATWAWVNLGVGTYLYGPDYGTSLTGWNVQTFTQIDAAFGNPLPSYNLGEGSGNPARMNITAGVVAGATIQFDVYAATGRPLPGFHFGCSSLGVGAYLCLDTGGHTSGICASTNWQYASYSGAGSNPGMTAGAWHTIVIIINGAGTTASWTLDGVAQETGVSITLGGPFIGLSGYTADSWWDNLSVSLAAGSSSPTLELTGQYYTGSVNANDTWSMQVVEGSGTNGTSTLTLSHTGSSGAASVQVPALKDSAGSLGIAGQVLKSTGTGVLWGAGTTVSGTGVVPLSTPVYGGIFGGDVFPGTIFCRVSGTMLTSFPTASKITINIQTSQSATQLHSCCVKRTALNGFSVIDSTPITFGGSSSPTFGAVTGNQTSDAFTLALDPLHDYWFMFFSPFVSNNDGTWGFLNDLGATYLIEGGAWDTTDFTAATTIPAISVTRSRNAMVPIFAWVAA